MQKRVSDMPPLLPEGINPITFDWIREHCVSAFPLSSSRRAILEGCLRLITELENKRIPCDLIVDGSYFTEEIDPLDIDFAVCVTSEFYENCSDEQRLLLEWIRDSFEIRDSHLSDAYLCVEYPEGHHDWFEGIQNRAYWVNLFAKSTVYQRVRGVGIVQINGGV
jgi:hypothetical protein